MLFLFSDDGGLDGAWGRPGLCGLDGAWSRPELCGLDGDGAGLDGDHHADEEYERVDRLDLDNRRDRCDEPREAQDLLLEPYY